MPKITFKFENDLVNTRDVVIREVNIDYLDESNNLYARILDDISTSLFDFLEKIHIDTDLFLINLNSLQDDEEQLEEDTDELDEVELETDFETKDQLSYVDFIDKLAEDELFLQKMYQVYQLYFDNND